MSNGTTDQIEKLTLYKEIWEKAVDTQMHFNDMQVRSRQLGLTLIVASLALAAILLRSTTEDNFVDIEIFGLIHVSALIILFAALSLLPLAILDIGVYHAMLRGAVYFGEEFERSIMVPRILTTQNGKSYMQYGMTQLISLFSRGQYDFVDGALQVRERKKVNFTARIKILAFYIVAFALLLAIVGAIARYVSPTSPIG